ncbi:uncharacterized protein EI97DRAFT_444924 [Westerdykella ornata]|uniref:LisH domain-containing protein n=1 Tax=Westerdykella ornata TaxID=318751 RepID=A0A6A6JAQ3_WESOR|nr:uncharacterized protein EI97DRAFT_444924 [Westerdykella ornata]KAF2273395.1 hypothetical protein EI97DRAFT_444924 [Westerdykella ornata]
MGPNVGGPVDGTPMMAHMVRPGPKEDPRQDPRGQLNTYIYDYHLRNGHIQAAKAMLDNNLQMNLQTKPKQSPGSRNVNGVDSMEPDEAADLPRPVLPTGQCVDNSFLMDWWCQFWDIFSARRPSMSANQKAGQYNQHVRLANDMRNQRINMMNPQYANMMRGIPNGVDPNQLKRAAMNNRNPNGPVPMGAMPMNKQAMLQSAQMSRDGSGMDMNGQRPQSPNSTDNAPSPNKRPRIEGEPFVSAAARPLNMHVHPRTLSEADDILFAGGMNAAGMAGNQFNDFGPQGQNMQPKAIEVYSQNLAQRTRSALNNHVHAQAMNAGVQGSPMNQQGLEGHDPMFAGNPSRPGMPAQPGQSGGNHALQDYQMQLMLLEQQNKKRLLLARQEHDGIGPHAQNPVAAQGFNNAMSPQGNRPGPSPNPNDMKRGTPKLNQQGLPGSPMPDAAMQPQRNSPGPMNFDASQMPPGMPPQFAPGYNQMQMRPPSSHPGGFVNGQPQLTPQQQMDMMRNGAMQQNGAWRAPGPQGMMPGQPQPMGGPMNNPQQRGNMPPPPAPQAGEQPRAQEPSPQQPAQAPPTPSQSTKANPKKKPTKDNKKPAKTKGANTGATPAASAEEPPPTPTPSTPITPMHPKSFGQNGQQQNQPVQAQPPAAPQAAPAMDNNPGPQFTGLADEGDLTFDFTNLGDGPLDSFDFDSFMHVEDDTGFLNGDTFGNFDEVQTADLS